MDAEHTEEYRSNTTNIISKNYQGIFFADIYNEERNGFIYLKKDTIYIEDTKNRWQADLTGISNIIKMKSLSISNKTPTRFCIIFNHPLFATALYFRTAPIPITILAILNMKLSSIRG